MKDQNTPEFSPTQVSRGNDSVRKEVRFSELKEEADRRRTELPATPVAIQSTKLHFPSLDESTLRKDDNAYAIFRDNQQIYPPTAVRETERSEAEPAHVKDLLVNKFIGEFKTDQSFKIIRGFVNQSDSDRIFYTRFEPTGANRKVNVLIIHGYGHSGNFLEVESKVSGGVGRQQLHRPPLRHERLRLLGRPTLQRRHQNHLRDLPGHPQQHQQIPPALRSPHQSTPTATAPPSSLTFWGSTPSVCRGSSSAPCG